MLCCFISAPLSLAEGSENSRFVEVILLSAVEVVKFQLAEGGTECLETVRTLLKQDNNYYRGEQLASIPPRAPLFSMLCGMLMRTRARRQCERGVPADNRQPESTAAGTTGNGRRKRWAG